MVISYKIFKKEITKYKNVLHKYYIMFQIELNHVAQHDNMRRKGDNKRDVYIIVSLMHLHTV